MSDSPASKFFGGLLIAAGLLIACCSGGCSVLVVVTFFASVVTGPQPLSSLIGGLVMVGIFGGVPFLIGLGLIVGGRAMSRGAQPPSLVPPPSYGQDPPDDVPRADL